MAELSMTGMQARFHHDVNCLFSLRPRQDMRHCLLCPTETGGCSRAKTGTHSGVQCRQGFTSFRLAGLCLVK